MARTNTARKSTGGKTPRNDRTKAPKIRLAQAAARRSAGPGGVGPVVRRRRLRPGVRALKEIRRLQKTTDLLIRRAPFMRLIKEISQDFKHDVRWTGRAAEALQEATESWLVELFELSNLTAIHAKRVTIKHTDMQLVKKIRGDKF